MLKRFVYRTRGVYALLGAFVILFLKHATSSRVSVSVFFLSIALSLPAVVLREWAASYVGGAVRTGEPETVVFVTAGPYAHLRHPIYLAAF